MSTAEVGDGRGAVDTVPPQNNSANEGDNRRGDLASNRLVVLALRVMVAVSALLVWEFGVRAGVLDVLFFSQPTLVIERLGEWLRNGYMVANLWVTLQETLLGFGIGTFAGVVVGYMLARWRLGAMVFEPYLKMFNAMPRLVLAPMFLLWFGIGMASKIALVVSLVFFIVFFNMYRGVLEVERVILDNGRMLGANERQLTRHILLPSAMTWIFSSLHLAVAFALIGAVVGEFMGASEGIGYVIAQSQGVIDTTGVITGIIILMVVVLVIDVFVTALERWLLRWQPTDTHG